jgi:hypothetical protein
LAQALPRHLLTAQNACVEAEPSQAAVEELSQREDERIGAQCERLGEDGLKQCGTGIEAAIRLNTVSLLIDLPLNIYFSNVF